MRYIIILSLLFCGIAYAEVSPKLLIEKETGRCLSWGYTDFQPTDDQIVIDGIIISDDINDGLKYVDGKIVSAPEYRVEKPKSLEERVSALEEKSVQLEKSIVKPN